MPDRCAPPCGKDFDVVLAGYFGFRNLGDELLASSAIDALVECGVPAERIAILTAGESHGAQPFDRWSLRSVIGVLRRSRSLLFAGGGLFQDATSLRSAIYYWGLSALASAVGSVPWAMAQSVGPLRTRMARWLAGSAFSRCRYITARDEGSRLLLGELGVNARRMPDLVLGAGVPSVRVSHRGPVLLNVRPTDDGEAGRLVSRVAEKFTAEGIETVGLAFSPDDCAEFERLIASGDMPETKLHRVESVADFARLADGCGGAVGVRLHFGILCYLAGIEPLLYPYDPKVRAFAESFGLDLLQWKYGEEGFDITNLLTNNAHSAKRKSEVFHEQIRREFELALETVMGGKF